MFNMIEKGFGITEAELHALRGKKETLLAVLKSASQPVLGFREKRYSSLAYFVGFDFASTIIYTFRSDSRVQGSVAALKKNKRQKQPATFALM